MTDTKTEISVYRGPDRADGPGRAGQDVVGRTFTLQRCGTPPASIMA